VSENESFVAVCPFASRLPFEVWIIPTKQDPWFENVTVGERRLLAAALQDVLRRLYVGLNDPSYNYFIYSAPCDETGFVCDASTFKHFRWHLTVVPRLHVWGGFELGTGLEINTMLPEEAAEYLRAVNPALP
jgi:UDPglucose--hexose-1-phosphate uridylyltransferase